MGGPLLSFLVNSNYCFFSSFLVALSFFSSFFSSFFFTSFLAFFSSFFSSFLAGFFSSPAAGAATLSPVNSKKSLFNYHKTY